MNRVSVNFNNNDGLKGEMFEASLCQRFKGVYSVAIQGKTDLMIGGRRCECKTGSGKFKAFPNCSTLADVFLNGYRILTNHYIVYSYTADPDLAIIIKTDLFFKVAHENGLLRLRKDGFLALRDMNYYQKKVGAFLGVTFENLLLDNGGHFLNEFLHDINYQERV
jgi:hypothetical protein